LSLRQRRRLRQRIQEDALSRVRGYTCDLHQICRQAPQHEDTPVPSENKRQYIANGDNRDLCTSCKQARIGWLRVDLEDLSFKFLMPELYDELCCEGGKEEGRAEGYPQGSVCTSGGEAQGGGDLRQSFRPGKHYYGIYQKMINSGISFDQIMTPSVSGSLRYEPELLYHHGIDPFPVDTRPRKVQRLHRHTKSNMYQSLHNTVVGPKGERIEFQIRTLRDEQDLRRRELLPTENTRNRIP